MERSADCFTKKPEKNKKIGIGKRNGTRYESTRTGRRRLFDPYGQTAFESGQAEKREKVCRRNFIKGAGLNRS